MSDRTYKLQVMVTNETRKRMELAKALIQTNMQGLQVATWSDVVEWLADVVPIPQLLAEACAEAQTQAPMENANGTAENPGNASTGSRRHSIRDGAA